MTPNARDSVSAAAELLLERPVDRLPERLPLGYGNENWCIESGGSRYLFKIINPDVSVDKSAAASAAYRLAAGTGAPVPAEVRFEPHCALLDDRSVRILQFLPGSHPEPALQNRAVIGNFFESFGAAVARLHSARCDAFASRVGGTPSFPTWISYIEYRVPQIIERCRQTGGFTESEVAAMFDRAVGAAREISDLVQPRLCHRDLYLDNVLIGADGRISALLDLDLAESWDPAVDFVKPRSQVFPHYPGAAEAFEAGYVAENGGLPPALEQRIRVTEVLELTNHVVNAIAGGKPEYVDHNRRRLQSVLAARW